MRQLSSALALMIFSTMAGCDDEDGAPGGRVILGCIPGGVDCLAHERCEADTRGAFRCVSPTLEEPRPDAGLQPEPEPRPPQPEPSPQPAPQPPPPPDPCAGVECPALATCEVDRGEPYCLCREGFVGYFDRCDPDDDLDGFPDTFEYDIATLVSPRLQFGTLEAASERYEHWSVRPTADGLEVFFALSYILDDGDGLLRSFWHYGDTEFVVVRLVVQQDELVPDEVFLSAHFLAETDGSRWYPPERFEVDGSDGGWHPVVWVGEGKHANYPDEPTCEEGAFFTDSCSVGRLEATRVLRENNLGNGWAPLIDEVRLSAPDGRRASESYWTPRRFCGWTQPDRARDESKCAELQNSYGRQLAMWEADQL